MPTQWLLSPQRTWETTGMPCPSAPCPLSIAHQSYNLVCFHLGLPSPSCPTLSSPPGIVLAHYYLFSWFLTIFSPWKFSPSLICPDLTHFLGDFLNLGLFWKSCIPSFWWYHPHGGWLPWSDSVDSFSLFSPLSPFFQHFSLISSPFYFQNAQFCSHLADLQKHVRLSS